MTSAILFLGTGTGPHIRGKQIRGTGGIVLIVDGTQFLIDPGPGCLVKAKEFGINLRQTTAVLVSHNHLSHANDVNAVLDAMTYSGLDRQGILVGNKTLFQPSPEEGSFLLPHYKNYVEKSIVLEKDQKAAINNVEIRALPTVHTDPHALGFKFMTNHFVLTYTGDTAYNSELLDYYQKSDILILNVPHIEEQGMNLSLQQAIKIIQAVNPALAIITHFSHKMVEADPIYMAREMQKQTKVQTISAKDGLVINPENYDAESKQKMLQQF